MDLRTTILNGKNIFAGLTPTFAGFATNPLPLSSMTEENMSTTLTTPAVQTNASTSTIDYDLTVSRRMILSVTRSNSGTANTFTVYICDDGVTWKTLTGLFIAGTGHYTVTSICKARYVRLELDAKAAGNTVSKLNFRGYLV